MLIVLGGHGLLKNLPIDPEQRCDFIPVDFVSKAIILGTAAQANKNSLLVIHSSTKHLSSLSLGRLAKITVNHFLKYPMETTYAAPYLKFVNPRAYKVNIFA
jgi:hypothetical protein